MSVGEVSKMRSVIIVMVNVASLSPAAVYSRSGCFDIHTHRQLCLTWRAITAKYVRLERRGMPVAWLLRKSETGTT
jgi:hypothetical protein